jgi:hypothetical protein
MDKQTTKLLEKLANKLGTTSEYLWEVLLEQATVQGFTILFLLLLVILSGIFLYKINKYFWKNEYYGDLDITAIDVVMIIAGIVWLVVCIAVILHIPEMIYAFVHPEYWALQEIIKQI